MTTALAIPTWFALLVLSVLGALVGLLAGAVAVATRYGCGLAGGGRLPRALLARLPDVDQVAVPRWYVRALAAAGYAVLGAAYLLGLGVLQELSATPLIGGVDGYTRYTVAFVGLWLVVGVNATALLDPDARRDLSAVVGSGASAVAFGIVAWRCLVWFSSARPADVVPGLVDTSSLPLAARLALRLGVLAEPFVVLAVGLAVVAAATRRLPVPVEPGEWRYAGLLVGAGVLTLGSLDLLVAFAGPAQLLVASGFGQAAILLGLFAAAAAAD